jgi:hypothetical protein
MTKDEKGMILNDRSIEWLRIRKEWYLMIVVSVTKDKI